MVLIFYQGARGGDCSDFDIGFVVGAQMSGASVPETDPLAGVSVETVAKVTSACRSNRATSVNGV